MQAFVKIAAETLQLAGCESAMVVNANGYDEIVLHETTHAVQLKGDEIVDLNLTHQDFGLPKNSGKLNHFKFTWNQ